MTHLEEAIASGQVSAAQIEAHRSAGELPAPTAQPVQPDVQEQEPTAWFAFADNNGPVPLELYGWDKKACKHAVLTYARTDGWKGTVEGYLMQQGWTLRPVYTAQPAQPKWTCFHCSESFTDFSGAQVHFGTHERHEPACQIDAVKYRQMEARMESYNQDDSDMHRQLYAQESRHQLALRREEEAGYARGLRDAEIEARKATQQPVPAYDVEAAIDRLSDSKRSPLRVIQVDVRDLRDELLAALRSKA